MNDPRPPSRLSSAADACMAGPPVVLVPACNRRLGEHPFHVAGSKYIDAVRLAGALPLVVPSAGEDEIEAYLALCDGVLLTGSPSNVHPRHFGEDVLDETLPLDPLRDAWVLALIPRCLAAGVPLLAICRGLQETNVALGGSLHQAVHGVPGQHEHRGAGGRPGASAAEMYAPAHEVELTEGGDHYDPGDEVVRLSLPHHDGRSVAALAVAGCGCTQTPPGWLVTSQRRRSRPGTASAAMPRNAGEAGPEPGTRNYSSSRASR